MSRILENLAVIERALALRHKRLARSMAQEEDAKMMKGSIARAVLLAGAEEIPMAQREELPAEAMTRAKHVYMETLSEAQQQVAMLRLEIGDMWPDTDVMDSYVFLVSEVGEVGDALLRLNYGHRRDYVRNNSKRPDLNAELGDVYLMLCTLATCLGIDLDEALQDRIDHLRSRHGHIEPINGA